jgi:hypothetical protein
LLFCFSTLPGRLCTGEPKLGMYGRGGGGGGGGYSSGRGRGGGGGRGGTREAKYICLMACLDAVLAFLFLNNNAHVNTRTIRKLLKLDVGAIFLRPAYYREKYGGGGRGGGRGGSGGLDSGGRGGGGDDQAMQMETETPPFVSQARGSSDELRRELRRIDGAGYGAYKDLLGGWSFGNDFTLFVDKIQSDPFAPPSRCHLRVPMTTAKFPPDTFSNSARRTALCDLLTRAFCRLVQRRGLDQAAQGQGWSGPKGGDLQMDMPGQQVLERTSVLVTSEYVEARFTVSLPAAGRSVLGQKAAEILVDALPHVVHNSLLFSAHTREDVTRWCNTVEDTRALRAALAEQRLVAFVGNGAILPRAAGNSDAPMGGDAVPFKSPPSLQVSIDLPHRGTVTGMGIPEGITLICGGGFHGKSTLLQALQLAVYDHIPGRRDRDRDIGTDTDTATDTQTHSHRHTKTDTARGLELLVYEALSYQCMRP